MSTDQQAAQSPPEVPFNFLPSRGLAGWLASENLSLCFSTYKLGKVFWIGTHDNKLSVTQRDFNRCMGLDYVLEQDKLYIGTQWQIWTMTDLLKGNAYQAYDRLYAPRTSFVTGDVDIHDVAVGHDAIYFANTKFSCIAKVVDDRNFEVVWQPPFISKIAAEDRCHLNGLALRDGVPAFATAVSQTDIVEGWRDHKIDGGVVIDIESNEIIASGLSMPHSPRWHNDKLWVANSGHGELGYIDDGKFVATTSLPGFIRGLDFVGDYAVVGLSASRDERAFSHLPLAEKLQQQGVSDRCGIYIVNLQRGDVIHKIEFEGTLTELYDTAVLPGIRNPSALGIRGNEAHYMVRFEA